MLLGIDFGTTNSAIVEYDPTTGGTDVHQTADYKDVLPSVIYIDENGSEYFGEAARDLATHEPDNAAWGFKSALGTEREYIFRDSGRKLSAMECCSKIMRRLKEQALQGGHVREITGAIVTVPVSHSALKRDITKEAALDAGFPNVQLAEEPYAAALESSVRAKYEKGDKVLVYDIGGGTFDFILLQVTEDEKFKRLVTGGVRDCGGQHFDIQILNKVVSPWMRNEFGLSKGFLNEPKFKKFRAMALRNAESAKISLSSVVQTEVRVPGEILKLTNDRGVDIFLKAPVSRGEYEKLIEPDIARAMKTIHDDLKQKKIDVNEVKHVVLVGGPCKTPLVREFVKSEMPNCTFAKKVDPMTAVASGASRLCETIDWSKPTYTTKPSLKVKEWEDDIEWECETRTSAESAEISISCKSNTKKEVTVRTDEGWNSGRLELTKKLVIRNIPLVYGENPIEISVTSANHSVKLIHLDIFREPPVSKEILQSTTLAIKIRHVEDGYWRNTLDVLSGKGQELPTCKEQAYTVARKIGEHGDEFTVDLFNQVADGCNMPTEPNIYIGRMVINSEMAGRLGIKAGTKVKIGWKISEGHHLTTYINGEENKSFMFAGEASYDGQTGHQKVFSMLEDLKSDIAKNDRIATNEDDKAKLSDLRKSVDDLIDDLKAASHDGSELQYIVRKTRDIRLDMITLLNTDRMQTEKMRQDVAEVVARFNKYYRKKVDPTIAENFDAHHRECLDHLSESGEGARKKAETPLMIMDRICFDSLWAQPEFVIREFKSCCNRRELAIDKEEYDNDIIEGQQMLAQNEISKLKGIVLKIRKNRKTSLSDLKR